MPSDASCFACPVCHESSRSTPPHVFGSGGSDHHQSISDHQHRWAASGLPAHVLELVRLRPAGLRHRPRQGSVRQVLRGPPSPSLIPFRFFFLLSRRGGGAADEAMVLQGDLNVPEGHPVLQKECQIRVGGMRARMDAAHIMLWGVTVSVVTCPLRSTRKDRRKRTGRLRTMRTTTHPHRSLRTEGGAVPRCAPPPETPGAWAGRNNSPAPALTGPGISVMAP